MEKFADPERFRTSDTTVVNITYIPKPTKYTSNESQYNPQKEWHCYTSVSIDRKKVALLCVVLMFPASTSGG